MLLQRFMAYITPQMLLLSLIVRHKTQKKISVIDLLRTSDGVTCYESPPNVYNLFFVDIQAELCRHIIDAVSEFYKYR